MPIYVDIISRLDERSAAVAARNIERQFGAAGTSAGDAAGRGMSSAIDRSTSNIGQRVTGQFTTHGQTAGRNFGTGFTGQVNQTVGNTSGFSSSLSGYQSAASSVGALAGKALGTAFTVAAGGLIGAASLTLFKGFERYKSIDAAKNRLENLNRTLESTGRAGINVKAVMDTVNQAVTDTPFALDKAFSVATRALASNTGDLKRFMTVVTDAAGFAGAGVDEIGDAFLKIANTGKVSMEEIGNELRNIPILPWLQEQLGVTGGQLQKMISDGKVGLNDLMKAVESHASGFAKASGNTVEGAMSNMQTSVARLGANFLGAIFGKPTEDGNQLVDVLKTLRERIDDVGKWVTAHQSDIRKFFQDGFEAGRDILGLLNDLKNALGGTENTIKILGGAFLAWKTLGVIKTVSDLASTFGKAGDALDVLPGKADKAGKGIGAALSAVQIPAWLTWLMKWGGPSMVGLQSDQKNATDVGLPEVKFDAQGRPYLPGTPYDPGNGNVPGYRGGSGLFDYDGDPLSQLRPNPARRDGLPPFSLSPTAGGPGVGPAGNPILDAPGSGDDAGKKPKLPDAPVIPYDASLPPGIPGMPADASVFGAESSYIDARQKLAEKNARVAQLEKTAEATQDDVLNARNEAAEAERDFHAADLRLAEARQGQYDQLTKQSDKLNKKLQGLTKDLGDVGASLDADFGISKGLAGIAENITKFVANLAAAPLLGQLSAIEKVNPTQGGHGIMGILGAQGVFGPMYQNDQYADMISGRSGGASAPGHGIPSNIGMPSILSDTGSVPSGPQSRFAAAAIQQLWGDQLQGKIGGSRDNNTAKNTHDAGLSIDIPIGPDQGALGDQINSWLQANAAQLGLEYSIWRDQGKYPGGGGFTTPGHQNHIDAHFNGKMPAAAAPTGATGGGGSGALAGSLYQDSSGRWRSSMPGWDHLIQRESSGVNQVQGITDVNSGGNEAEGLFQITPQTWISNGGARYAPNALAASPQQQADIATQIFGNNPGGGDWGMGLPGRENAGQLANELRNSTGLPASFGGGGPMGSGMPQGLPMGGPTNTTTIGANVAPPAGTGKGGVGMDGGGVMGMAMQAGGMALDAMAPGAGQAAQVGIKLMNRAIQYGGQVAGIATQGVMETFLPTGGSELANNNWLTRIVGGIAGAAPALPNLAGKGSQPPLDGSQNPNDPNAAQAQQQKPPLSITVNNNRQTEDGTGKDIAYHAQNMYAAPGM